MPKWEYLEVYARNRIRYTPSKLNDLANLLKAAFPEAKIKAKEGVIETNIWDIKLYNFLGNIGWELIVGYDSGAPATSSEVLFKRSIPPQPFFCQCSFFDGTADDFHKATITVRDSVIETERHFNRELISSIIPMKNIARVSITKKETSEEDETELTIVMIDDAFQTYFMKFQEAEQLKNIFTSAIRACFKSYVMLHLYK